MSDEAKDKSSHIEQHPQLIDAALPEAQAYLNSIIASAMDAIITVDEQQRVVLFNPAAEALFGWTATAAIGKPLDIFIPARFQDVHQQHVQAFGENGTTSRRMGNLGTLYGVRVDGTEFPLEATISQAEVRGRRLYTAVIRDITNRVRNEELLRQSEERYRAVVEDLPGLICRYKAGGIITFVNDAYCDYFGKSRGALLGQSFLSLIPEAEHEAIYERIASLTLESPVSVQEHPVIVADGTVRWQRWVDRALFDQKGNVVAYQSVGEDVTEQWETKAALLESEERYRSMVAALGEGIVLQDAEGVILACNASAEQILGLSAEQMMGRTSLDPRWRAVHEDGSVFPGEIHPAMMTLQTGHSYNNVVMGIHKPDGELTWISINSEPLFKPDVVKPYAVVASFTDITERKQAGAEFQLQKTILEAQLEASIDGLLITSPQGEWLFYNQRLVELWQIPPEIVATRSSRVAVSFLSEQLLHPETVLQTLRFLEEHSDYEDRVELVLKDGRTFDRYTAPVKGANGEYYGRLWTYRDVTPQKELEAQLLQAQKMEAIGRLAGGIAHDFNNYLVPMISYAELSMMSVEADSRLHSYLERIVESAERAADITQQILAFSRQQVLTMHMLDLNLVIINFEKMIRRLIGENIKIEMFLTPDLAPIRADKSQLEQVLMNLVINARDAMLDGGKLTLETANVYLDANYTRAHPGVEVGHYVMLAVSDNGHGMDEATQRRIFDPFFTTKETGKGTGLGLATVFGIVKQHRGNIWAYSEPRQGATFKIYLPQVERGGGTAVAEEKLLTSLLGTETILVVEDEEMVRELVRETLVAHGYTVLEAASPEEGLRLATEIKEAIHLLLTDVIMPGMNGRQLYEAIRLIHPQIPVLYMSGYTDNVIVHHGILDEGIHFLQKPFNVRQLTQKVRQALD